MKIILEIDTFGFERPGIGRNLLFLSIEGAHFFLLLFIADYRILQRIFSFVIKAIRRVIRSVALRVYMRLMKKKRKSTIEMETQINNTDVLNEENRITKMTFDELKSCDLVVKKLSKTYGKFVAVNRISFAIERYA